MTPSAAVWENLTLWQRNSFHSLWLNISDHSTKPSLKAERRELSGVEKLLC